MLDYNWCLLRMPTWWPVIPIFVLVLLFIPLFFSRIRLAYLAIVSLVFMSFATFVCWRSYYVSDSLSLSSFLNETTATRASSYGIMLITGDGGILVAVSYGAVTNPEQWQVIKPGRAPYDPRAQLLGSVSYQGHEYPLPDKISVIGFKYWAEDRVQSPRYWTRLWHRAVAIPFWILHLPFVIFPAFWAKRYFRNRSRRKNGLCLKCAYNLKESKDKCPECGHPVPPRKEIAKAPDAAKPASE